MSLPLDSHPAAPKGCCDTPLESPGTVKKQEERHEETELFYLCHDLADRRRGNVLAVCAK